MKTTNSITPLLSFSSRGDEFLNGNSGLAENSCESASLDLAMVRNHAPRLSSAHDNVTAALPRNRKSQTFESADGLRA